MKPDQFQFEQIWRLRFLQRNQEALALFDQIDEGQLHEHEDWTNYHLLKCAFIRLTGDLESADRELELVETRVKTRPAKFYIQRGAQLGARCEHTKALEQFMKGFRLSRNLFDWMTAGINVVNCMEYFGHYHGKKIKELREKLPQMNDDEFSEAVNKAFDHLELRNHFRHGNFSEILVAGKSLSDQGNYFCLWLSALPYVSDKIKRPSQDLENFLVESEIYLKEFRSYTLTGDLRFREKSTERLAMKELIDRLYLWTWNWLYEPSEQHHQKLSELLSLILSHDTETMISRLTNEDINLFRSSFRWIEIFSGELSKENHLLLKQLGHPPLAEDTLFSFEDLLIDYFQAKAKLSGKTKISKMKKLSQHPFFGSTDFCWQEIITRIENQFFQKSQSNSIVIYPDDFILLIGKKKIISEPLTKAILFLLDHPVSGFDEFLSASFAIPNYEKDVHSSKIHNTLQRLKEVLPKQFGIKTRNEKIYFEALKSSIAVSTNTYQFSLDQFVGKSNADHRSKIRELKMLRTLSPSVLLQNYDQNLGITRTEIQEIVQLSKASTNKWISKWVQAGRLLKKGNGKGTSYFVETEDANRMEGFDGTGRSAKS